MPHVSAHDLEAGTDQFAGVDPYELAILMGFEPEDFASRTQYCDLASLDDQMDAIHNFLEYLEGEVPAERIAELTEKSQAFESGGVESDAELTLAEREIIENSLSQQIMKDGGGWIVATQTVHSVDGIELEFQAEIGDGGECFGCYGPYQIRDGNGLNTDMLCEGESW